MRQDICVYTTKAVLDHKKKDGSVYWVLPKIPKNIDELSIGGKIYFAIKCFIVGYFDIETVHIDSACRIEFHSHDWIDLKVPIPTKQFQGFKYVPRG